MKGFRTETVVVSLILCLILLSTPLFVGLPVSVVYGTVSDVPNQTVSSEWIEVAAPGNKTIKAVVFQPTGNGPFPVVVVLHGADGFRQIHVDLAGNISQSGRFIAVAGCWFAGSHFQGMTLPDSIGCAGGPSFKSLNLTSIKDVMALVEAARKLPNARSDRVGLVGHSRGGAIAVLVASSGGGVQAVVSAGGFYTQEPTMARAATKVNDMLPITLAENLQAPILILHGTADEVVDVRQARDYESRLRQLGKTVESHYYDGAPHSFPFLLPWQNETRIRIVDFLTRYLFMTQSTIKTSSAQSTISPTSSTQSQIDWLLIVGVVAAAIMVIALFFFRKTSRERG